MTTEAMALLTTAPPAVTRELALSVAESVFGFAATITPLSGERDRNFLVIEPDGGKYVLKFINSAESEDETDLQISAMLYLSTRRNLVRTPSVVRTHTGRDRFAVVMPDGTAVRGRAYSFLEGASAVHAPAAPALRQSVGRVAAQVGVSLEGFEHPAANRIVLWDISQAPHLKRFADAIADTRLRDFIAEFLEAFATETLPRMNGLRSQVIHNDLSPSNLIVDSQDLTSIVGVLDFGDMLRAPLVCELAVAASYQMANANDPRCALRDVVRGFESITPLMPNEHVVLIDLVLARLVLRIVISEWRSACFPENSAYILRSNPEARRLLSRIEHIWREGRTRARRHVISSGQAAGTT